MPNEPFIQLQKHFNVSHETLKALSNYSDLLMKWQKTINLVSPESLKDIDTRHFLDSAQVIPYLPEKGPIIDLGSGAGFPGMVVAIMTGREVDLIESDGRKAAFLSEVARVTGAKARIHHGRIEESLEIEAGCVLARALAPLDELLALAKKFVSHETTCLFHKGKNYSTDIDVAKKHWSFDHKVFPSLSDEQGVILQLTNIRR